MTQFAECLGFIAPYYNLVLVVVVLILFFTFFKKPNKKIYLRPWKILLAVILVYILEESLTVLHFANVITLSKFVAPILEMLMIALFIYMLLLQKEYLKTVK